MIVTKGVDRAPKNKVNDSSPAQISCLRIRLAGGRMVDVSALFLAGESSLPFLWDTQSK